VRNNVIHAGHPVMLGYRNIGHYDGQGT